MKIFKTDKLLIALVAFISLVGCSKKNDPAPQKVVQQPVKPYKYNYGIESYMIINGDTLGLQGGNISAHLISTKDTAEYTRYTVEKNSVIGHEETKLTLYDIKHNGTYSKLLFINDSIRHYTAQTYFKFKYNNIYYTVRDSIYPTMGVYNRNGDIQMIVKDAVLVERSKVTYKLTDNRPIITVSPDKSTDIKVSFRLIYTY